MKHSLGIRSTSLQGALGLSWGGTPVSQPDPSPQAGTLGLVQGSLQSGRGRCCNSQSVSRSASAAGGLSRACADPSPGLHSRSLAPPSLWAAPGGRLMTSAREGSLPFDGPPLWQEEDFKPSDKSGPNQNQLIPRLTVLRPRTKEQHG